VRERIADGFLEFLVPEKNAMSFFYLWLGGLSGTSLAVVISYIWLDRPIAFLAHSQFSMFHHSFFWELSWIPNPLISIAVVVSVPYRKW
jgi:hypothetical protein